LIREGLEVQAHIIYTMPAFLVPSRHLFSTALEMTALVSRSPKKMVTVKREGESTLNED
jgi:hypothetical protein